MFKEGAQATSTASLLVHPLQYLYDEVNAGSGKYTPYASLKSWIHYS